MTVLKWSLACFVAIYVLTIVGLAVFQRRLQYFQIVVWSIPRKPA